VADAVKASRIMQAVAPPIDMMDDEEPVDDSESDFGGNEATRLAPEVQALAAREAARERPVHLTEDEAPTKVAQKALDKLPEPVAARPEPVAARPEPKKDSVAKPLPARPAAGAALPAAAAAAATRAPAARRSMVPLLVIILVLAAGGFAVWWFLMGGNGQGATEGYSVPIPGSLGEKGANEPAPPPKPAPRLAAKVIEESLPPIDLTAPIAGKVALLAAPGEVAQGASLLTLAGSKKWEEQKSAATSRRDFYQGELDRAQAKGNTRGIEANGAKVKEKQDLIAEAEAELAKLTITAPEAGTVELSVTAKASVKAGQVIGKLTPKRKKKLVRFDHLEGFMGPFGAGGANAVRLVARGKDAKDAIILPVDKDETSTIVTIPDEAPIAAGDDVELLPVDK
jgi:hypothetical protein